MVPHTRGTKIYTVKCFLPVPAPPSPRPSPCSLALPHFPPPPIPPGAKHWYKLPLSASRAVLGIERERERERQVQARSRDRDTEEGRREGEEARVFFFRLAALCAVWSLLFIIFKILFYLFIEKVSIYVYFVVVCF